MSMIYNYDVICANCGYTSTFSAGGSYEEGDHDELDTRPPVEYIGDAVPLPHICVNCGYCSPDLEEISPYRIEIINSQDYKKQLYEAYFPAIINRFLCYALILEKENQIAPAGWTALHAFWFCDDNEWKKEGNKCRMKAIEYFKIADSKGAQIYEDSNDFIGLLTDIHRRAENFDDALKLCEMGLTLDLKYMQRIQLLFERKLIRNKDSNRYSVLHVLNYEFEIRKIFNYIKEDFENESKN